MSKESEDRFVIIYTLKDGTRKELRKAVGSVSLALIHFNLRMTEVLKDGVLCVELFDRRQQKTIALAKWDGAVNVEIKKEDRY